MIYLEDVTSGVCIEADIQPNCIFAASVRHPTQRGLVYNTYPNLLEAVQFVYDNRYKWNISLETEIHLQKLYKEYCEV